LERSDNPGLELANAFGVTNQPSALRTSLRRYEPAFGVTKQRLRRKRTNAFGVNETTLWFLKIQGVS